MGETLKQRTRRVLAFEKWLDSQRENGVVMLNADRLVLDIAFSAGWRAMRASKTDVA